MASEFLTAILPRSRLAWLFLVYAIPAVLFLSVAMAPFQVPDEYAHTLRADQVARGGLWSSPVEAVVHGALIDYGNLYRGMWFHPEVKQTVDLARQAGSLSWSVPDRTENFQNTLQYGPVLYAPQAVGLALGRGIGLSPAASVLLARLLNAFLSCAVGFLALRILRHGRALAFTTLLFAMTLSQFASVSQDALIISLSILAIALASRSIDENRTDLRTFAVFAAIVAATTMARPSQILLGLLLPAFVSQGDSLWRQKATIAGLALIPISVWFWRLRKLMPPVPSSWSPSTQFHHLLAHPLELPAVMVASFLDKPGWLLETVVGRLGWLDTPMQSWYFVAAAVAFVCALIAPGNPSWTARSTLVAGATFLLLLTAICGALYLSWTPVDKPVIDGLQGRYILPVLPLLGWLAPAYGARLRRWLMPAWLPVLLFPLLTLAALPPVIMERYYGSWLVMRDAIVAMYLP